MRLLIHALKKNTLCAIETIFLYIVFFIVELQTTIKIPLKIKSQSMQKQSIHNPVPRVFFRRPLIVSLFHIK